MDPDITTFFAAIALLILLAVTSIRFGVDSRRGLTSDQPRGIV